MYPLDIWKWIGRGKIVTIALYIAYGIISLLGPQGEKINTVNGKQPISSITTNTIGTLNNDTSQTKVPSKIADEALVERQKDLSIVILEQR